MSSPAGTPRSQQRPESQEPNVPEEGMVTRKLHLNYVLSDDLENDNNDRYVRSLTIKT